ncbi:hypothetical protein LCGC14_0556450 [marine sediment metagenome]|uniref:Uncharacterized protein n=1 Tax=marine sediment metagenome TaxID=412755 RepID=A0A0F9S6T5_9ZZZZ
MKDDKFLDQKAKDMSIKELISAIKIREKEPLQIHISITGKENKGMSMMGLTIGKLIREKYPNQDNRICPDCGGLIRIRNPTGKCDHLYYPEMKIPNKKDVCKECGTVRGLHPIIMGCQKFIRDKVNITNQCVVGGCNEKDQCASCHKC